MSNNGFDHPTWPDPFTEYASSYACLDTYVDASPIARADSAYQMVGNGAGPMTEPVFTWYHLIGVGVALGVGAMLLMRGGR